MCPMHLLFLYRCKIVIMPGMNLRHLRAFVSIADAGGFARGANRMNLSQPALSRQIHDLESELEVALFEPSGRRLRLTGAGEDLLAYGRKVLNEAEAFRERARVLHRGDAGVVFQSPVGTAQHIQRGQVGGLQLAGPLEP